jgi:tetratricopeptide (TPR) repeat protein
MKKLLLSFIAMTLLLIGCVAPAGKIPYKEGQPIPPDYCNPLYTPTDSYAGEVDFGHNIIMRYELRKHNNILDLSGNMAIPWDNINAFRLKIVVAGSDCIAKKVYTQMMKLSFRIIFNIFLMLTILAGCATTEQIKETDPIALLDQGTTFGKKGQYDRAIAYLNKALDINPKNADAYNFRGNAYASKGQYDKAISDYDKALELNPRHFIAYNNRGTAYFEKGQHDKAIADYNKALELNPEDAMAYSNRAAAYSKKGQHDKAISDCNKALELNSRDAETYGNRGNAYTGKGQYDKAIADYNKALELNPEDAMA